jgi:general secretion pathway protein J
MRRPRRDGFTLLEVLVAISLVAALIVTLAGGLRLGTRAWESARVGAELDDANTMVRAIAGQLERAFAAKRRLDDGLSVVAFAGDADGCRFVTLSEGTANWGGLVTTEIGRDGAQGLDVWTKVYREDDFAAARESMRATRLTDRLEGLSFAYYGETATDQKPQWRDAWRNAEKGPRLVRLTLRLRGARGALESDATIALPMQ